jgi:hypothetical protein
MRLGEKVGLYAEVAKMYELRWPASNEDPPAKRLRIQPLDLNFARHHVRRVWRRMRASLDRGICITRDLSYLRYRYLEHPTRTYAIFRVDHPIWRHRSGLMVLRVEDQQCELVDLIAPLNAICTMLRAARCKAHELGCSQLYCWISDGYANRFADASAQMTDLGISVPTSRWVPGPEREDLVGKWFLMSGDTEFR